GWLSLVAIARWRHQFVDLTHVFAAEQITNTMREALLVFDQDGAVRVVNRAACALLARPETDVLGRPLDAFNAEICPRPLITGLLEKGDSRNYAVEVPAPSGGGRLALDVSTSVVRDRAGAPSAVVCIARDVTERKRAEETLRASEERFRSVAESAADGSGAIVSWNRGAQTIFGYTEADVRGRPLTLLMPERYRDPHRRGLERLR